MEGRRIAERSGKERRGGEEERECRIGMATDPWIYTRCRDTLAPHLQLHRGIWGTIAASFPFFIFPHIPLKLGAEVGACAAATDRHTDRQQDLHSDSLQPTIYQIYHPNH